MRNQRARPVTVTGQARRSTEQPLELFDEDPREGRDCVGLDEMRSCLCHPAAIARRTDTPALAASYRQGGPSMAPSCLAADGNAKGSHGCRARLSREATTKPCPHDAQRALPNPKQRMPQVRYDRSSWMAPTISISLIPTIAFPRFPRFVRQRMMIEWSFRWAIRLSRNCGGSPVTRGEPWLTSSKQPCEATSRRKRSRTSRPRTSPPPSWPCCPSCPRSRALRGAARRPGPMRRAEVWWAELPPPVGPRPVVVLTRDAVCDTIGAVVAALITDFHGLGSNRVGWIF